MTLQEGNDISIYGMAKKKTRITDISDLPYLLNFWFKLSYHGSELKDWKVHGNDETTEYNTEKHHDNWFHE